MRSPANLSRDEYDLLVVGGGIHGASTAAAAARGGFRVALIEKADFGGAASANSLKVIHGGLRYLQHLDIRRMRESIHARSLLLRLAPHLVRPRAFLMPTTGLGLKSLPVMAAALLANDVISMDRNQRLARERTLPHGRVLFAREARESIPADVPGLTGAAIWNDAVAEDTERLTLAFVRDAYRRGAETANYVAAVRLLHEGSRVVGVEAKDMESGHTFPIRARAVIWTGGPWLRAFDPSIAAREGAPRRWVRAVNLVLRTRWPYPHGAAIESSAEHHDPDAVVQRGKRNFFFVPWRGGVMVGTWYEPFEADPDALRVTPEEIETFVADVASACPALGVRPADVTMVHAGILPAHHLKANDPAKMPILQTGRPEGLLVVQGVKYTTGPLLGAVAARRAVETMGGAIPRTIWDEPLPGGHRVLDEIDVEQWCGHRGFSLPGRSARHLVMNHGTEFPDVLEPTRAALRLRSVLTGQDEVIAASVVQAVRAEFARTLGDVVLRRTGLGTFARPARETLLAAARLMAEELGWSPARVESEVAAVDAVYASLGLSTATPRSA